MKNHFNQPDPHHKVIFDKLFKAVGFPSFDANFVKSHTNWFQAKAWTREQEEKFAKWFIAYVAKNYRMSKKCATKEWEWFNLKYGWKRKGGCK